MLLPAALVLELLHNRRNQIIRAYEENKHQCYRGSTQFCRCINRAHYQNVTFVLLKNGKPVARLVPDNEKVCLGRDLAETLAKADLPQSEARGWRRYFRAARKKLKARPINGNNS